MSDCQTCPVEPICHYPYKPCECVQQRKFWDEYRAEGLCPHGMPLAENICGPCSQGRPNRRTAQGDKHGG